MLTPPQVLQQLRVDTEDTLRRCLLTVNASVHAGMHAYNLQADDNNDNPQRCRINAVSNKEQPFVQFQSLGVPMTRCAAEAI